MLTGRVILTHLFGGIGPVLYGEVTDLFVEGEVGEVEFTGGRELPSEHPDHQSVALYVNPEITRKRLVVKRLCAEKNININIFTDKKDMEACDTVFLSHWKELLLEAIDMKFHETLWFRKLYLNMKY